MEHKNIKIKDLFKKALKQTNMPKINITVIYVIMFILSFEGIFYGWSMNYLIENVLAGTGLITAILIFGFGRFGFIFIDYIWRNVVTVTAAKVRTEMRIRYFDKIAHINENYLKSKQIGELHSYVVDNTNTVADLVRSAIPKLLFSPLNVLLSVAYLIYISDVRMVVILLPLTALKIIIPMIYNKKNIKLADNLNKKNIETYSLLTESLSAKAEVKMLQIEDKIVDKYKKNLNDQYRLNKKKLFKDTEQSVIGSLMDNGIRVLTYILGAMLVFSDVASLANVLACIVILDKLAGPVNEFIDCLRLFQGASSSINIIDDIDNQPTEAQGWLGRANTSAYNTKKENCLSINNLYFSFGNRAVLEGLSMEANKGEITMIAGKSGAGKTTLLNILLCFYSDFQGEINLDGKLYSENSPSEIRNKIYYMPQEAQLFELSISENIKIVKPDCSNEELNKAIEMSNLNELYNKELGLDTVILENGVGLSGGQKQRISLARGFLRDSDIYILDEPTTAVDSKTRQYVMEFLARIKKDKIIICVTHQKENLEFSDRVVFIEDGKAVCSGKHRELLKNNKKYYSFINACEVSNQ